MKLQDFLINRTQLPTLHSAMDAYSLRQRAIANNIANVETVGYKKKEVDFEEDFRKVVLSDREGLARTHRKHFPNSLSPLAVNGKLKVSEDKFFNGINNVDIDKEIALLTKTQINYDAMTKLTTKHFKLLKMAIKGM